MRRFLENDSMLWQLFCLFFKIGCFTFGSGYAMIPMIKREVVERRRWFDEEDFSNQFVLAQSAPGPFSLNTAVFVGYRMKGCLGALVAVLGAVIPSFVIILLIAMFLSDFDQNGWVLAAFKGIRPAVVALIAIPFVQMLIKLKGFMCILGIGIALFIWISGISPVYFLLAGGLMGLLSSFQRKS